MIMDYDKIHKIILIVMIIYNFFIMKIIPDRKSGILETTFLYLVFISSIISMLFGPILELMNLLNIVITTMIGCFIYHHWKWIYCPKNRKIKWNRFFEKKLD